jgi:hypothetical protein
MKRLKNASVFFLTLLLGLCVLSTSVSAEYPWVGDAPMLGKEEGDDPPGPRGGPSSEDSRSGLAETLTFSGFLTEISYRIAEFCVDYGKTVSTQNTQVGSKNESTKVK